LDAVELVCVKVRKLYNSFKHSVQRTNYLLEAQGKEGERRLKLIGDVATRWNSVLFMLRRAAILKTPIRIALAQVADDGRDVDENQFLVCDWDLIDDLVCALVPIERLSKLFEGEKYGTASTAVIRLIHLQQFIAGMRPRSSAAAGGVLKTDAGYSFKCVLCEEIGRLFGSLAAENPTLHKAAFFDPRVKTLWWLTDAKSGANDASRAFYKQIESELRQEYNTFLSNDHAAAVAAADVASAQISVERANAFYAPDVAPRANPSHSNLPAVRSGAAMIAVDAKDVKDQKISAQIYEPPIRAASRLPAEFDRWLTEERTPLHADDPVHVLDWWRANESRFPYLSLFAKRYLAVPISAAPVERVWSAAGRLVVRNRMALSPDTIADQVFLHENS